MTDPGDPRVGDLAEAAILRVILDRIGTAEGSEVGPGDDAAVLRAPDGRVVATTDTLVHGPDFRLAWSSGTDLGWKAAAVNLADVAAMGARPTGLLVALAMPADTRLSFVRDFADGLAACCDALAPGCAVIGGDLTISSTLTIAVTALGSLEGRAPVLRSGARPGDIVALAGAAGLAARGIDLLFSRFTDASGPVAVDRASLDAADLEALDAQLRPSPPIALGIAAADAGATAMMDVSDGLALDATRLAQASGVTLAIRSASVGGVARWAIDGGEDHALLATFPRDADLPEGFRAIGEVTAAGANPLLLDGEPREPHGWDPYRDWDAGRG
ncbi:MULTISPECIES: thiamine-phosphate kinase [unclassified Microbacterium]|uniref:thiamine-phosphate kinase n=1 Tax=unclassified Microbacterium TaxID=2609290 RepID=UPI000C2BB7B0|nr:MULTISPECIES: thiamine-phosphate kinase [unclassified Microbacterium]